MRANQLDIEAHTDGLGTITIEPSSGWKFLDIKEAWHYRELLYFLMLRDIKVRYRQTILGGLWAIIQPVSLALVFTIVFDRVANVSSQGVPYPLFAFSALLPWTLFSSTLRASSDSLVAGGSIISKIYFPRIVAPLAASGSFVLDFAIGLVVLVAMMIYYSVAPSLTVLWFPLLTVMALVSAFAVGVWLAALNVRYRDIRYAVPFLLQLLVFASPLGYSSTEIEGPARILYAINPVTGVAEGFRWALLGVAAPPVEFLVVPTLGSVVILLTGLLYFRATERTFADLI